MDSLQKMECVGTQRKRLDLMRVRTKKLFYRIPQSLCETADVQWGDTIWFPVLYNKHLQEVYNEICSGNNEETSVVEKPSVLFIQAGFHHLSKKSSIVKDLDRHMKMFSKCYRPIHIIVQFFTSQRRSMDVKYPRHKRENVSLLNADYADYATKNWNVIGWLAFTRRC
mmetsp:Transcript_31233/g.38584  ORF Transcript_31233/g.38584 Transcript_31233/m.38584 type:complete len:168 (+) Transcript_31233:49-552(+)